MLPSRGKGAGSHSPVPDILPLLLPVCGLCYGPSLLGPRRLLRRRPLPWIVPRRPWSFSFYRYPSRFLFLRATGSGSKYRFPYGDVPSAGCE